MRALHALAVAVLAPCAAAFVSATAVAAPSPGCTAADTGTYDHLLAAAGGEASTWDVTTAPLNVGEILVFTVALAGGDEATNVSIKDETSTARAPGPGSDVTSVPFRLLSVVTVPGPGPTAQSVPHMIPISSARTLAFALDNETSAVASKADITVICLQSDPPPPTLVLTKEFDSNPVVPGDAVTLTYVVRNRLEADIHNVSFTDPLPAGLFAAAPSTMAPACGGDVISTAAHIKLEAGAMAPGASCSFSVTLHVSPDAPPGAYASATSAVTGEYFGVGIRGNPASTKLIVDGR